MKGFSKFFTPPFSRADREAFFECLGLSMLDFLFMETSGSLILRARQFVGSEAEALLSPKPDVGSTGRLLVHHHPTQAMEAATFQKSGSLWEELFPYPFNLVSSAFTDPTGSRLIVSPESWKAELHEFWEALSRLEERMSLTEVSCLWVKGAQREMPVLFHFVRKRRIRVGTDSHLYALSEKYRTGSMTPRSLQEHFGTQAAFFYLDLQNQKGFIGLPSLAAKTRALIQEAGHAVEPPSRAPSVPEIML